VTGGYALALALRASGPLAIVAAGLLIGNYGRHLALSERTRDHLDTFWELVEEILNAVLFVLIGLEILILTVNLSYLVAGVLDIPIALAACFISVGLPVTLFRVCREFTPHVVKIMIWGTARWHLRGVGLVAPAGP
jgi:CPA1 family monovalent cation:H+ antiporter